MTSGDPRESVLRSLARELHVGPLRRRRILTELADHIDDAVDDLRDAGVPQEEAVEEAVERLGDAETIAGAFGAMRARLAGRSRLRARHSLAWIAVAVMSVVTGWAAELPQASGAKPPAKVLAPASRHLAPADHPSARRPRQRARAVAGTGRGRLADRF